MHVDVGGQAGHQAPDRIAVEERSSAAAAGARTTRRAGRRGSAAPPASSGSTAGRGTRTRRHRQPVERRRCAGSPLASSAGDVAVDGDLQQIRLGQRARGGQRQADHRRPEDRAGTGGCTPTAGASGARRRPCRAPPRGADRARLQARVVVRTARRSGVTLALPRRSAFGRPHSASISSSSRCWRNSSA